MLDPSQLPGIFGGGIQMPAPSSRGGMFGGGKPDWGSAIAAAIQGFQAARGVPGAAQGLAQLHQQRMFQQQQALEAQQYQQRRKDANEDWQNHFDYEAAHRPAPEPTQTDRYISEILDPNTPADRRKLLQQVVLPPVMGVVNGVPAMIDRASMLGGTSASQSPPPQAIQELKANPHSAAQFDEIFGQGSAARILGGPTLPASGGFRLP